MDPKETINLREKFLKWCERTTVHAIPNIASNNHYFLKLMWIICFLASICYCFNVLTTSVVEYYKYGVLTTYDIGQESSARFPVIIICRTATYNSNHNNNNEEDQEFLNKMAFSCSFGGVIIIFGKKNKYLNLFYIK